MHSPSLLAASRPASPEAEKLAPDGSGRLAGLDALRGVAAIAVTIYHFGIHLNLLWLVPRGYLAVDFFFVLSGYVLLRAFGAPLESGQLRPGEFIKLRLVRLYPLIALGLTLGALAELGHSTPLGGGQHAMEVLSAFVLGGGLLPVLWTTVIGQSAMFPLNGPMWSLFFEMVANAVLARWRLPRAVGAGLILMCAAVLVYGAYAYGSSNIGSTSDTILFGFARVGFSFTVGAWLATSPYPAPRLPFAVPLVALLLVLMTPLMKGVDAGFDLCAIFVVSPLLVWLTTASRFTPRAESFAIWLGAISYPLYCIHYPVTRVVGVLAMRQAPSDNARLALALGLTVLLVVLAWGLHRFYDTPLRRKLLRVMAPGRRGSQARYGTPAAV